MQGKAVVLLDGMYFQNILNAFGLSRAVDYQKFTDKLARDHERARTYVFDSLPFDGAQNRLSRQKFLDRLSYLDRFQVEMGYVRLEKKRCPKCNETICVPRQKKVDILIATRLLECSFDDKIDKIVLVAGDADFVPAVEIAKKKTEIVLAYAEGERVRASTDLKKVCDRRIRLEQGYFDDCKLQ